ncbi:MFS transporter [Vreelandella venusta]|uniref:MFS transporter n=1 Tax=Vreelandella venusta TaxID=44935 RepID=A0AAP9ZBW4_9GAMM|nr:MFS transporter [Halomonas venusta]QRL02283.1 MFS transporter [Halomonas venusta]GEK49647.1 MFS transporter [Halomonas venusta]
MRTALIIGSLGAFFNLYQLQALFPALVERFGTTATGAGWLTMASLLGMMITAPLTGAVTRHANPLHLLVVGFIALAAINASMALTTSQDVLFVLRLGQGIVIPFLLTATMNLVSQRPSSFVSLYVTGTIVGSTLSRFYPAWSVDAMGWELGFLSSAFLMVLSAVAICLLPKTTYPKTTGAEPMQRTEWHQTSVAYTRRALTDSTLLTAYLAGFALLFTQSAVFTALGLWLAQDPYHWNSQQIGTIYLACLPALFCVLTASILRRYLSEVAIAIALIALIWAALWLISTTRLSIMLSVALFAIGTYLFQTVTTRLLSSTRCVPAGVAAGIYLSCYYLGGAMGASLAAYAFAIWAWKGVIACIAIAQAVIFCLVIGTQHCAKKR